MPETAQTIREIVERFKEELKKNGVSPERVILYGSYAAGKQQEGSDIDLIVISGSFKNMNLRERLEILGLAAGRILEPIEALGYTEEEIRDYQEGFLEEILGSPFLVKEM